MATAMLDGGADVRFVQEMLGHVSLATTQVYTRVSVEKLKAVHAATHPAARLLRSGGPTELPLVEPELVLSRDELLEQLAAESAEEDPQTGDMGDSRPLPPGQPAPRSSKPRASR